MGAFGGLITFDGAPPDPAWLRTLGAALGRPNVGSGSVLTAGPVTIVLGADGADSDPATASSIWTSPRGSVLAFDGYLHNADALQRALGIPVASNGISESPTLLAGLERVGPSFADGLIGEYAFAYWDNPRQELTFGRDAIGARTLYLHRDCRHSCPRLLFSTDLGSLIRAAHIPFEPDDDYLASFLIQDPYHHLTPYRSVSPVRPGHAITVSPDGVVRDRCTWELPHSSPPIFYRHDHQYVEHFAHLFSEAVQVRLRSRHPITSELSGGLDSSSVVCLADHLLRSDATLTPSLHLVSYVYDQSATTNESSYVSAVEQRCDRAAHRILESQVPLFTHASNADQLYIPSYLLVMSGYETAVCAQMEALRSRVLLSGVGGDEMFYATNLPLPGLADLWARARFRRLHREVLLWSKAIRQPYTKLLWRSFKLSILRRVLPPRTMSWTMQRIPSWVHTSLHNRIRAVLDANEQRARQYTLPSQRDHADGFYTAISAIASGHRQEFGSRHVTYPCLHRPLVEFLHAVPFSQKLRRNESRSLQRRALKDILPTAVLARRGKASGTEASMRSLRSTGDSWEALLTNSQAAEHRYVDVGQAKALLRRVRAGLGDLQALDRAIALEIWLRAHSTVGRVPGGNATSRPDVRPAS